MEGVEQPAVVTRRCVPRKTRQWVCQREIGSAEDEAHSVYARPKGGSEANVFARGAKIGHQTRAVWKGHPNCVDFKCCIYLFIAVFRVPNQLYCVKN